MSGWLLDRLPQSKRPPCRDVTQNKVGPLLPPLRLVGHEDTFISVEKSDNGQVHRLGESGRTRETKKSLRDLSMQETFGVGVKERLSFAALERFYSGLRVCRLGIRSVTSDRHM